MSAAVLFRHPSSVLHDTGSGHPERAARIVAIEETLTALGWLGYEVRESPAATDEQLGAVHPASHTDALRALCADGGGWIDGDTVTSPVMPADANPASTDASSTVLTSTTPSGCP